MGSSLPGCQRGNSFGEVRSEELVSFPIINNFSTSYSTISVDPTHWSVFLPKQVRVLTRFSRVPGLLSQAHACHWPQPDQYEQVSSTGLSQARLSRESPLQSTPATPFRHRRSRLLTPEPQTPRQLDQAPHGSQSGAAGPLLTTGAGPGAGFVTPVHHDELGLKAWAVAMSRDTALTIVDSESPL